METALAAAPEDVLPPAYGVLPRHATWELLRCFAAVAGATVFVHALKSDAAVVGSPVEELAEEPQELEFTEELDDAIH
jgi:hypothetical protein